MTMRRKQVAAGAVPSEDTTQQTERGSTRVTPPSATWTASFQRLCDGASVIVTWRGRLSRADVLGSIWRNYSYPLYLQTSEVRLVRDM
jgi:hypothetical protein